MNIEFFKNVAEFRPEKQLKLAKVVAFNFQGTILRNSKYEVHFFLFFGHIFLFDQSEMKYILV